MRMTFSTFVTPTRERLTWVDGRRAWTSLPRSVTGSFIVASDDTYAVVASRVQPRYGRMFGRLPCRARQITQVVVLWPQAARPVVLPPHGQPFAVLRGPHNSIVHCTPPRWLPPC